ncbi:uncharacterized protein LOC113317239 [Papaver somniferum]|uniref:uncharacterized protein LOC113317239 n=1 Tax=Papaver somniferum TaxID=3469 RepID=UPI000E703C94|nr:uncharacterized protein LOC113317239 [Papaver somniferum]XP_026421164.1 uncharacterized protein LOC113317239 [Papaver somniferum]
MACVVWSASTPPPRRVFSGVCVFILVYMLRNKLAADQCVDDSDKTAFLLWNVKQELERHGSFIEESSKEVSMSTSKEADEMSESEITVSEQLWINCTHCTLADQCVDDSDKAAFLLWSDNVKQGLQRHNSFIKLCNSLAWEEIEVVERLCRQAMGLGLLYLYRLLGNSGFCYVVAKLSLQKVSVMRLDGNVFGYLVARSGNGDKSGNGDGSAIRKIFKK